MLNDLNLLPPLLLHWCLGDYMFKSQTGPLVFLRQERIKVSLELQLQSFSLSIWEATNRYNTPTKPMHRDKEVISQEESGSNKRRNWTWLTPNEKSSQHYETLLHGIAVVLLSYTDIFSSLHLYLKCVLFEKLIRYLSNF